MGIRLFFKTHNGVWFYLAGVGGVFAAAGLFSPPALRTVYSVWMRLARAIGWLNTKIILSLVFYIFFMPMGLVIRIFKRDLLGLKIEKRAVSYWIKGPPQKTDLSQYEKQF